MNMVGMKWGQFLEETKKDLLSQANPINGITGNEMREDGNCIIDLTENLSVAGAIENGEIIIDDNAILYDPSEGVITEYDNSKNNIKFIINEVMTMNEAAEKWNITEGAIRKAINSKKFICGVDYRKSGRITLITKDAMIKNYGELK